MTTNNIVLLSIGAFIVYQLTVKKPALNPEIADKQLSDKYNIHLIPDNKYNYRSGQIPKTKLPEFIRKYGIKHVIRFNGNGQDSRKLTSDPYTTIAEEKAICEANNCEFHFIDSHLGYVPGKGYTKSLEKVIGIMKNGHTLVHCLHGADRTGGMVGGWLKSQGIITDPAQLWKYTTQYNIWKNKIRAGTFFGSGYDKYAETFITKDKIREVNK